MGYEALPHWSWYMCHEEQPCTGSNPHTAHHVSLVLASYLNRRSRHSYEYLPEGVVLQRAADVRASHEGCGSGLGPSRGGGPGAVGAHEAQGPPLLVHGEVALQTDIRSLDHLRASYCCLFGQKDPYLI